MVRPFAILLALLVTGPSPGSLGAHALHTSFTEIVKDVRTGSVTVSVRLFSDDFQATLDSIAFLESSRGVSVEAVAQRYFERSVSLETHTGNPINLAWCGMRTADGLTWLCAKSVAAVPNGKLLIRNALMFDRFADQISIVRWPSRTGTRTLVLSARVRQAILD